METRDIALFQEQLKKTRLQSYFFLGLLMLGACLTAFAFYRLHHANHEIEQQNIQLEKQKSQLKEKATELKTLNQSLISLQKTNQGYSQKDSLIQEINTMVNKSNAQVNVRDLATLSLEQLKGRVNEINKQVAAYNKTRLDLIKDIYSSNSESKRKKSRNRLEKEFSVDENLVGDIVGEIDGKITMQNKDAYYQFIYLLRQLDADLLKPEAAGLNKIFDQGKKAGLHGSTTQAQINQLIYKMR